MSVLERGAQANWGVVERYSELQTRTMGAGTPAAKQQRTSSRTSASSSSLSSSSSSSSPSSVPPGVPTSTSTLEVAVDETTNWRRLSLMQTAVLPVGTRVVLRLRHSHSQCAE